MLVISIFVSKIRLNFHYKKITEKMYDKVVEKHFQVLKIGKAFSHFDFNSTIRKKIRLVSKSWLTIQINSPTYLFSI